MERKTWSGRESDGFEVILLIFLRVWWFVWGSLCRLLVFDLLISRTAILIIVIYFLVVLVGVVFGFWGLLWNFLPLSIISSLRNFCEPSSLVKNKQAAQTPQKNHATRTSGDFFVCSNPQPNQSQLSLSLSMISNSNSNKSNFKMCFHGFDSNQLLSVWVIL